MHERVGSAARPGGRRPITKLPLGIVVALEVALGLAMMLLAYTQSAWRWSGLLAATALLIAVIPWRAGLSPASLLIRRLRFVLARARRRGAVAPVTFDIPTPPTGETSCAPIRAVNPGMSVEQSIGARWSGGTLITVLRVQPPSVPWSLGADSATPAIAHGQFIPLDALAECISPFDIPLDSIDVVSHGWRVAGTSPAAMSYRQTLGPLPATAVREVFVILRLNPRRCTEAIARRGGGSVGALRAASITTRRVARRLTDHGLDCVALGAAEITSLTTALTGGAALGDLTERWAAIDTGRGHLICAALAPEALARSTQEVWAIPSAATTLTIRLAHDQQGALTISGVARLDRTHTAPAGSALPGSGPSGSLPPGPSALPGLRELTGAQFDALTAGLPLACHPHLSRRLPHAVGDDAQRLLTELHPPAGGCGQLIGADEYGRGVTLRIAGPSIDLVIMSGSSGFVAQTVLRTVAIGTPVIIHTNAHTRWRPLVTAVADTRRLAFAEDRPPISSTTVALFDGVEPLAHGGTRFVVTGHDDATIPRRSVDYPRPTIVLSQNPLAPQQISINIGVHRRVVHMVATPAEWSLIGVNNAQPAYASA